MKLLRTILAPVLGVAIIVAILASCGASQRQKTIRVVYDSANAASDQLNAFSRVHEQALLAPAKANPTPETIAKSEADIAAFRAKVEPANKARDLLYHAIADAALLNDDHSIAALVQAAADLHTALQALGVAP